MSLDSLSVSHLDTLAPRETCHLFKGPVKVFTITVTGGTLKLPRVYNGLNDNGDPGRRRS